MSCMQSSIRPIYSDQRLPLNPEFRSEADDVTAISIASLASLRIDAIALHYLTHGFPYIAFDARLAS